MIVLDSFYRVRRRTYLLQLFPSSTYRKLNAEPLFFRSTAAAATRRRFRWQRAPERRLTLLLCDDRHPDGGIQTVDHVTVAVHVHRYQRYVEPTAAADKTLGTHGLTAVGAVYAAVVMLAAAVVVIVVVVVPGVDPLAPLGDRGSLGPRPPPVKLARAALLGELCV